MSETRTSLDFGFYNMDCMEGMKQFPDKFFDLAIVDPPYGINIGQASMGAGGRCSTHQQVSAVAHRGGQQTEHPVRRKAKPPNTSRRRKAVWKETIRVGGGECISPKIYKAFDDSHTPDAGYFKELERVAKHRIIWGGNYFLEFLGATSCLITWDKRRRGLNFADCEIAWTDFEQPSRIFEWKWNGMLQEDMADKEYRIHPTQKPVKLYEWLLNRYAKPGDIILDTHVGSASSLIACRKTGHKYVGFELDKYYFEQASKRLQAELDQVNIFDILGE